MQVVVRVARNIMAQIVGPMRNGWTDVIIIWKPGKPAPYKTRQLKIWWRHQYVSGDEEADTTLDAGIGPPIVHICKAPGADKANEAEIKAILLSATPRACCVTM